MSFNFAVLNISYVKLKLNITKEEIDHSFKKTKKKNVFPFFFKKNRESSNSRFMECNIGNFN